MKKTAFVCLLLALLIAGSALNAAPSRADGEMAAYLREMKNSRNLSETDLTPAAGEYYSPDGGGLDPVPDPEGELYGFPDDLTQGCSVWCAVNEYEASAEASSALPDRDGLSFRADNLLSGTRMNGWAEAAPGNGIGETISITKTYSVACAGEAGDEECIFFYGLCVVNGLAVNEETWRAYGRASALKFCFNGEYMGTIELMDTMKPQYVSLSGLGLGARSGEKSTFTFEIAGAYPGERCSDTAITGIEIAFDTPNH